MSLVLQSLCLNIAQKFVRLRACNSIRKGLNLNVLDLLLPEFSNNQFFWLSYVIENMYEIIN